jgi:hypothetical protein
VDADLIHLKDWWVGFENSSHCTANPENRPDQLTGWKCQNITVRCAAEEPVTPADQANGIVRKVRLGLSYVVSVGGAPWADSVDMFEFTKSNGGDWQESARVQDYNQSNGFNSNCQYAHV